jgi:hypothetical protein
MRFAEALDAVLFESRGTLALCFREFKESCVDGPVLEQRKSHFGMFISDR